MILFFEDYSALKTIFLYKEIKKAEKIIFYKPCYPNKEKASQRKREIIKKIIKFFNKKASIETVSIEETLKYGWEANKQSIKLTESLEKTIKNSGAYKILEKIYNENIIKAFKHILTTYLASKLLYLILAKKYSEKNKVILVSKDADFFNLKEKILNKKGNIEIPKKITFINNLGNSIKKHLDMPGLLLLPFYFLLKRGFSFKKINKIRTKVIMPMIWGVDEVQAGMKKGHSNLFLYNEDLEYKDIAQIFDKKFTKEEKTRYKRILEKYGISYLDKEELKLDSEMIKIIVKTQLKLLKLMLAEKPLKDFNILIDTGIKLMHSYYKEILLMQYIDYKVALLFNDISYTHIVSTILNNKKGKLTVGMQHSAGGGPYVGPQLSYIYINKYCVWGNTYKKLFSPFWKNIEKIGHYRADYAINIIKNKQKLKQLKEKFKEIYGNRYTILILLPSMAEYNMLNKRKEIFSALEKIKDMKLDINIILRPRQKEDHKEELEKLKPEIKVELDNFTTPELIALCDLIISNSHSSSLIEAVSAGKPAFTFDFPGTAKIIYRKKYGKNLVLSTSEDILKVINGIKNNFKNFNCKWKKLQDDYNYYHDGKCTDRFRKVILNSIKEVDKIDNRTNKSL